MPVAGRQIVSRSVKSFLTRESQHHYNVPLIFSGTQVREAVEITDTSYKIRYNRGSARVEAQKSLLSIVSLHFFL